MSRLCSKVQQAIVLTWAQSVHQICMHDALGLRLMLKPRGPVTLVLNLAQKF